MKLTIIVEFDHQLSPRCQADVKNMVQDFKGELEVCGGKVVRADLMTNSDTVGWGDTREKF